MENTSLLFTESGLEKIKEQHQKLIEARENLQKEFAETYQGCPDEIDTEYIVFLEQMEVLTTRIEEYESLLTNARILPSPQMQGQKRTVQLGVRVHVVIDGETFVFQMVCTKEADPASGKISPECSIGQALLGRRAGERIPLPDGHAKKCYIKKVSIS